MSRHPETLVVSGRAQGENGDAHRREEANVPGDHVEPESVAEAGALGEVGELSAHGLGELSEERATKSGHGDVRGDGPSAKVCMLAMSHALCRHAGNSRVLLGCSQRPVLVSVCPWA